MKFEDDPTQDIYRIMNESKLDAPFLQMTRRPFSSLVNEVRTDLAQRLTKYINAREAERIKPHGTERQQGHNSPDQDTPKIGGIGPTIQ